MTRPTREATEAAVRALAERPSVAGAILGSRDGIPLVAVWPRMADVERFVAMQAAALGAAELAAQPEGDGSVTLIVEMGRWRYVARGIGPEAFIVVLTDASCSIDDTFGWLRAFAVAAPFASA